MSVNRRYGCSDPDCESVILNSVASQGAGSTYKVFVAAAALAEGYSQYHTITTSDPYTSRVYKKNGGTTGEAYRVGNAGNYPPTLDMRGALVRSSNTYFIALEDALRSVEKPVRMAQAMGLHSLDARADAIIDGNLGSFTLGAEATSPLDLASAYGTMAANGTQCDPKPVLQVLDRAGAPLEKEDGTPLVTADNCTPEAIPPGVATTLNQILIGDVSSREGTGTRAAVPGHEIAGKTGTSQDRYSAAFVGYTPQYTASVMVLNPKKGEDVGGFGGNKPATIWHDAMAPILTAQAAVPFPPADPKVQNGNTRPVPDCSSVDECEDALDEVGLDSTTEEVDSDQPAGTFLGSDPKAGTRANADQTVTILVSNGSAAAPAAPPAPEGGGGEGDGGEGDGGEGGGDGGDEGDGED
jgi:membrane peptidoglycan carboxypeptidase